MPAALVIPAIAALAGAGISAAASSSAAGASQRSAFNALQFEREREERRRKEYDDALALQKEQWEARQRTRQALARRYGVNLPSYTSSSAAGGTGGTPSATASDSPRLSLGSLMSPATSDPTGLETSLSGAGDEPPQTLGDLAGWEQWQKYGLA